MLKYHTSVYRHSGGTQVCLILLLTRTSTILYVITLYDGSTLIILFIANIMGIASWFSTKFALIQVVVMLNYLRRNRSKSTL